MPPKNLVFLQPKGSVMKKPIHLNRRQFLIRSGLTGIGAITAISTNALAQPPGGGSGPRGRNQRQLNADNPGELTIENLGQRAQSAYQVRVDAAQMELDQPLTEHITNGDEEFYPTKDGSFSKTLPHNNLGEVDPGAYNTFLQALSTGQNRDFERIPQAGSLKLANPQAAFAYALLGPDPFQLAAPPAPTLVSAETAGEMVEVYWHALLRDVNFDEYNNNALVAQAASELSSLSDFRGPKERGNVTPDTLFRGNTPGDLVGPYISQFLYQRIRNAF